MAADQRRKRLNGASIVGCNSREQHKAKKKTIGFLQDDSNIKSHISLEWDQKKNRVVAKRDQIGVSCRNLRPFVDSSFNSHKILADVCAVPHGIYDLENLEHVLSYEVWQTHLSENERNHLMQFLPRGSEAEQVVEALLDGDFFDFGNPLLKWGASLCSGDLHPDAILIREQYLQTDKNAYYKGLQKYHTDMIAYLLKLKEICASSKDSEHEIVRKMWRSRNDVEKQTSSHANESRFRDLEENVVTSESCSWAADEKACSSDNQISSLMKGEVPNRIHEKGFLKDKGTNFLLTADKALNIGGRSKKGDQPNKRNIYGSDGSKYMSYVKISKKQYEIFKSMKQSGKNIQSRSLNRVLGNLDSFNVQPYEVFVEEEQKKLHQHWLKLANRDLPAAYEKWMEMHLQRRQMMVCLEKDMKIRLNSLMEDDEGEKDHESVLQDEIDVGATNHQVPLEDDDNSVLGGSQADDCNPTDMEEDEKSPKKLPGGDECNSTYVDSEHFGTESDNDPENHIIRESDHSPPNISKYAENLNCVDAAVNPGAHLCASGGVWKAVRTPHSYYDSTIGHQYPSASELSLAHPHVNEEQRTQLVALESALPVGDTGKDLLHRQSVNGSFSSYPNQDRNELHSLFKGQSMLSYNHEQIQTGLDLRPPTNVFLGDSHFPGHFEEQQHQSLPLELGQKRDSEVYMQQNLPENMYSDGGRYLISRHEDLAPVNGQDWAINGVRMPGPLQSHLDGGEMLSHNWFSGGHQVRGGWSASGGTSVTNQSIGSGANGDQSLFSVLSHCNQLRSSGPYHAVASTEQFISRGYGMVGGVSPRIGNVLPPAAHALDYMGGRETADVMTNDDMQWINLPHPNSGLRDPMGKPFLRSWNQ